MKYSTINRRQETGDRKRLTLPALCVALLSSPLLAQSVSLSNAPLATENQTPPTIMITADDSWRSQYSFSPDDITIATPYGGWTTVPEVLFHSTDTYKDVYFTIESLIGLNTANDTNEYFKLLIPDINRLAYNPLTTYVPPPGQGDQTNFTNVGWLTNKAYHQPAINLVSKRFTFGYQLLSSFRGISSPLPGRQRIDVNTAITAIYGSSSKYWTEASWKCTPLLCDLPNVPANYVRQINDSTYAYQWVVIHYSETPANVRVNGETEIEHGYLDQQTGQWKTFKRTAYQEAVNYANWAAYYRNRTLATKTVMSLILNDLCRNKDECPAGLPYIGFSTINRLANTAKYLGKDAYDKDLEKHIIQSLEPTKLDETYRQTLINRVQSFIPVGSTPLVMAHDAVGKLFQKNESNKYIKSSCQKSYHIAFTDGIYTDYGEGSRLKPSDTEKTLARGKVPVANRDEEFVKTATKYYSEDLNNNSSDNHVPPTSNDPANWQHLNLYAMGFATASVGKTPERRVQQTKKAVEAAKGQFYATMSIDELKNGMRSILAEIMQSGGTRAGAAVDTPNLADNQTAYAYVPSFASDWSGNITRYKLNIKGALVETTLNAADKLKTITPAQRTIFTRDNVAFTYDALNSNSGLKPLLKNLSIDGQGNADEVKRVIAYLRGDRSNEGMNAGAFRQRSSILGDIVNSAPVVVGAPACYEFNGGAPVCNYSDDDYLTFYNAKKTRGTMVYAAMNDGMLHAFDEDLNEKWAYIPSVLLRSYDQRGLITLTRQPLADTRPFRHNYYLDATPSTFDVRWGGGWHTVLIGGMGKGGKSYYALDVTNGSQGSGQVLWEYTAPNMGYSFGRPLVTRTKASGDDWVAILPSGYNHVANNDLGNSNATDTACLHIVDVKTGTNKKVICADGSGKTDASEMMSHRSGKTNLVAIAGYVADENNQITTTVYGGDSSGKLWRFNLESNNPAKWAARQLGDLGNVTGTPQYVTTEPVPMLANEQRYVVVGTGGFRNENDLKATTAINTVYAFVDGDKDQASTIDLRQSEMVPLTYNALTNSTEENIYAGIFGWAMNLPAGYHVTANPVAFGNVVVIAANKYLGGGSDDTRCSVFTGMVFAIDVTTGLSMLLNNDGRQTNYIEVEGGIADLNIFAVDDGHGGKKLRVAVTGLDGTLHSDDIGSINADLGTAETGDGIPHRMNMRTVTDE